MDCNNLIAEKILRRCNIKGSFLDSQNVLWKLIDNKLVGKRSVWTYDNRACWLEETTPENVKDWWCDGKSADYDELFYRTAK